MPQAAVVVSLLLVLAGAHAGHAAQPATDVTDLDLDAASAGHLVAVGSPAAGGRISKIPLEVYVARVLAGEAEPAAPPAAMAVLAIAVRTYATFNAGRHSRDGYDLCDTTHCQVMRAATPATRRAALATAGRVVTYKGEVAEIFYSASCGGRSEDASAVFGAKTIPYLRSVADDVHKDDEPWVLDLTLDEVQKTLRGAGFEGRLRGVTVGERNRSGRVAVVRLDGMQPATIKGDQFRAAIGARDFKSTAFAVTKHDKTLRFTGRGYGHGVGLCVIGAGRRARRGESAEEILEHYYPGTKISALR